MNKKFKREISRMRSSSVKAELVKTNCERRWKKLSIRQNGIVKDNIFF